jgi:2,4-dienoyl-CoA reductase-like NADH-dependent reductase (Old Yellow Enzyme family)
MLTACRDRSLPRQCPLAIQASIRNAIPLERFVSALFSEFELGSGRGPLKLANRIVVAPMCQYSCVDGLASDWHLMHWGNLLNSGAGLFTIEATAVSERGRITPGCLGLYNDATAEALADVLGRARRLAPPVPVSIQIGHAGRKGSSHVPWNSGKLIPQTEGGWWPEAPSAVPITAAEPAPEAISPAALDGILKDFVRAAQRAQEMGIEAVELHGAHGYLLHEFLSPISNQRSDNYGGSFENRIRFPLQVFEAVRQVYSGSLGMRLSATDWVEGGWTGEETADFSLRLKQVGANFMHISSGGVSPQQKINLVPGYQVPFAKMVKDKSGLPTMAVGLITEAAHAEAILVNQEADLIALARSFLYNPRWAWAAAAELQASVQATPAYWRCMPREAQHIFNTAKVGMR